MKTRPLVVLDTTVLISAFITPGGAASEVLDYVGARFTLVTSIDILAELSSRLINKRKLRERYRYTDAQAEEFVEIVEALCGLVVNEPAALVGVVRDPNDDMIVACAATAHADFIVTRDKDLLSLGQYESTRMVTPRQFIGLLGDEQA